MYKGYARFDGTEVINVARTMAYIKAGLCPPDFEFEAPVAYEGLAESLGHTYRTPVLDEAPWYDEGRPETHGFAGLLVSDLTGLYGSTATREVVESIDDGGVAQMVRRTTRTIMGSALLIGDSSASVLAGLEWLTTVLLRQCTDRVYSALLEGFNVLPSGFTQVEDLTSPAVDEAVDPEDGWLGYGGTWHPGDEVFAVEPLRSDPPTTMDGGLPWTVEPDPILDGGVPADDGPPPDADGGDPDEPGDEADAGGIDGSVFTLHADGGGVEPEAPELFADGGDLTTGSLEPYARLVPPVELTCLSEVTVTWTITPLPDTDSPVVVQLGAVDELGRELYRRPETDTLPPEAGPLELVWVWQHAEWDQWWPALWMSAPGAEVQVSVARRPFLDANACLAPIRRTYADLATIAAPSVVGEWTSDCDDSKLLQVEWTWSVGNPYRYGNPTNLVVALPSNSDDPPASAAEGVEHDYLGTVTSVGTACAAPPTLPASCAYDPALPGFVAPPEAPVISDGTTLPVNYHRSLLSVTPGVLPGNGTVALGWTFENDSTAKHNVRVRIWQQADPDFDTHDECSFLHEFWITYIDADATFTIDGDASNVIALCDGAPVPAGGVMRGPYRGAFEYPVLACGGRYFITVDTGSSEGALAWTLAYSPREG